MRLRDKPFLNLPRLGLIRILLLFSTSFAAFPASYNINVTENILASFEKDDVEEFFRQVYAPVQIAPSFVYFPSDRGLSLVDKGVLDAEAVRFDSIVESYKNFIKVPVPLGTISAAYFCSRLSDCLSPEDKKIGVMSAYKMGAVHCQKSELSCYYAQSNQILAKVFGSQRIDLILSPMYIAPAILCQTKASVFYYMHIPELDQQGFHFVNRVHQSLVPDLTVSIQAVNLPGGIADKVLNTWQQRIAACGKTLQVALPGASAP